MTAERASSGLRAPSCPSAAWVSSTRRSITWPGPSSPSAPSPHKNALPAKAAEALDIPRLVLMNAVMYDSWPAPTVMRFRDPDVAAATTPADILAARRQSVIAALARPATEAEILEWLDPWTDPRVARSWLSMAVSADHRYTMALVPALKASAKPKLLIWGEDDGFQKIEYAERFAAEIPNTRLVRIPKSGHIPTENDAPRIAREMIGFFKG